jgi:hypothetical protein
MISDMYIGRWFQVLFCQHLKRRRMLYFYIALIVLHKVYIKVSHSSAIKYYGGLYL